MANVRLAFLGFGNVGKALAHLLLDKQDELQQRYDLAFRVTGIATGHRGKAVNLNGIDLEAALVTSNLRGLNTGAEVGDEYDFMRRCQADVLFESIPVNYASGQPALDFIRFALENEMHVATANKGPVIHGYRELTELAHRKGRRFFFESTVMDGAPIFSLFRDALPGANLLSFTGVLNSTTNMILTQMEGGASFEDAVAHCQQIGIAETDPSGDIDGWDASIKVALLASVLMQADLKPDQVDRTGIRQIGSTEIQQARQAGRRWKLMCRAWRDGDRVRGKVAPELVDSASPFYGVERTTSLVQFETDVLGKLSLLEEDPGPHTTAYGMFADFLNAVRPR